MVKIIGQKAYFSSADVSRETGVSARTAARWFSNGYIEIKFGPNAGKKVNLELYPQQTNNFKYIDQAQFDEVVYLLKPKKENKLEHEVNN